MPRRLTFDNTATRCAIALACAFAACVFAACGDDGDGGGDANVDGARPFKMGFSTLPRELNAESYEEAIAFAGDHGELALIHRDIPWADFFPGAEVNEELAKNTVSERDAIRDADLDLFFAIDVTDGASGRDRLVGLPPRYEGKRFDDPAIRAAFLGYAEYVAINYKPDYMALGVEMNLYYTKNRDDWDNFRSLYAEAYAAVKSQSPDTQVTVTLQYEDLAGVLPREDRHSPDWHLIRAFDPDIDFIGISTYPSFAYSEAAQIPEIYYTQLRAFADEHPIAIAEMGFSSAAGPQSVNSGTEEQQAAFLARALTEAEEIDVEFAVWFAIWDPAYARDTEFAAFQSVGLLTGDNTEKPAWRVWDEAAKRPYR